MNIIIKNFKEQEKYSFNDLGINFKTATEKIIFKEQLLEKKIIEFVKSDGIEKFKFNFVGLFSYKKYFYRVYPKYIEEYSDLLFVKLIKVLEKYLSEKNLYFIERDEDIESSNFINLILDILNHYNEYGLYTENLYELNNENLGEINWEKTIENKNPLFFNKNFYYFDLISTNRKLTQENLICQIQKQILAESSLILKNLKKCGLFEEYEEIYLENSIPINEETDEFIRSFLTKELSQQYAEKNIILIKLLLKYIELRKNYDEINFYTFGTTYFHIVWEVVCKNYFNDISNKYKQKLIVPEYKLYLEKRLEYKKLLKNRLIPDIVFIENDIIYIFDAKYYKVKIVNNELRFLPGIEDITKQIIYEKAFEKLELGNYSYYNAFIFPKDEFRVIGNIKFEIFENKEIKLIYLDATEVYDYYLKNKSLKNFKIK